MFNWLRELFQGPDISKNNYGDRFGIKICDLSTGYLPGSAELRYNRETGELVKIMQTWISMDDGQISAYGVTREQLDTLIDERHEQLESYVGLPQEFASKTERELMLLQEARNRLLPTTTNSEVN